MSDSVGYVHGCMRAGIRRECLNSIGIRIDESKMNVPIIFVAMFVTMFGGSSLLTHSTSLVANRSGRLHEVTDHVARQ